LAPPTPTELDVVRLVREGLANKDIATRLFVSPRTVEIRRRPAGNSFIFVTDGQLPYPYGRDVAGLQSPT
jgi:FixJ family two-component response regulator